MCNCLYDLHSSDIRLLSVRKVRWVGYFSTHEAQVRYTEIWWENLKERASPDDLFVDGECGTHSSKSDV